MFSVAPFTTAGLVKTLGTLLRTVPGAEAGVLDGLAAAGEHGVAAAELREPGAVILVGERLAESPGALSAALRLADATGARLAWVPRRAGERGALAAGALPSLLPGGRPVADAAARAEVGAVWGTEPPSRAGRDTAAIIEAAAAGRIDGVLVAGVDLGDLPDPEAARAALARLPFVVSLEVRHSSVTDVADVVLPVAPVAEKAGSFVDWEGRLRPFQRALDTPALPDLRILHMLAAEMGVELALPDTGSAARELAELGRSGEGVGRAAAPAVPYDDAADVPEPAAGQAVLATWHQLVDDGRLSDGEPFLAGTARAPVALLSPATAAEIGVKVGQPVAVTTDRGTITLPLGLADLPDRVVWVPTHSPGSHVRADLVAGAGALVGIAAGADPADAGDQAESQLVISGATGGVA